MKTLKRQLQSQKEKEINISNKKIDITITDMFGIENHNFSTETNTQIDLSLLPSGIFFVKIQQDNNLFIEKLIIQH